MERWVRYNMFNSNITAFIKCCENEYIIFMDSKKKGERNVPMYITVVVFVAVAFGFALEDTKQGCINTKKKVKKILKRLTKKWPTR